MVLNPGSIIGDKYRLGRRLATGGQGSIWVAEHIQLGSQVALKFLDQALLSDPSALTRFEREARAAAGIRHQNLVHVEDCGFEAGVPYLVMELFEGEDLLKRLKSAGRLPVGDVARLTNQIARGLRRLHEAGYVHRDLKPGNIFLARTDDGEEIVKILDFGIVKKSGPDIGDGTKTGEFVGSPQYMSPEQIQNLKAVDARSDLWSLAVVIFRGLTSELPFPGDAIAVVVGNIITGRRRRASDIVPTLSPKIDEFFDRAFSHDPSGRFASAIEMAEAFARAAGARAPMPSSMEIDAWEAPQSGPGALPAPLAQPAGQAEPREGTTLPRPPKNVTTEVQAGAEPGRAREASHPPPPPAYRTSDPTSYKAPASGSPLPSPPESSPSDPLPLSGLKRTQPLRLEAPRSAHGTGRTLRIPIAKRAQFAQSPAPPPPPHPPPPPPLPARWDSSPSPQPPLPASSPVDSRQTATGAYARPEPEIGVPSYRSGVGSSDSRQAGTGSYARLEVAGRAEITQSRRMLPASSTETIRGELGSAWTSALRAKGRWVAGGLLVGTGVGALIALLVALIRR